MIAIGALVGLAALVASLVSVPMDDALRIGLLGRFLDVLRDVLLGLLLDLLRAMLLGSLIDLRALINRSPDRQKA